MNFMNFRSQLNAKSFHDGKRGFQGRVSVFAKRAVQLFARKPRLPRNLSHAFRAGNDA